MITRYVGGTVPSSTDTTPLDDEAAARIKGYREAMDRNEMHLGAQETWALISRANQYVEETAPWNLAKAKDDARLASVLAALARSLARITLLIQPFIPSKAAVVWTALGQEGAAADARWPLVEQPLTAEKSVMRLTPLFPKPQTGSVTD